uniref:Subtilisin-like protease n=1 Tax=Oryza brachyantha TaxID=4533 RepID=J3LVS0_ORYBR
MHSSIRPLLLLGAWSVAGNMGEGIIVGVLDSGVDPRHASFGDEGMRRPPPKWRGRCDFGGAPCNNKLIGGRAKTLEDHGTHTASTAVGAFVGNVEVERFNLGTASGMAPRAHLAMYEVCFADKCSSTEMLTETEKSAFIDGVDVLSISASDETQKPFYDDLIAVGSFSAVMSGVFFSTSAGNNGPTPATVTNCAPWQLTVGASTMGRRVLSKVQLGNGLVLDGEVPNSYGSVNNKPIVYVRGNFADGTLKVVDVRGKIVLCDRIDDQETLEKMIGDAGGVGMIAISDQRHLLATTPLGTNFMAVSRVSYADGETIKAYVISTANPTASLRFAGIALNASSLPAIAEYSSRGPCDLPNIGVLKPDITGPGTNIVAAVPDKRPGASTAARTRTFSAKSGTSMSTPHLSGIAAVIKKAHPDWSPHVIKSALMTTADVTHPDGTPVIDESTGQPASHFAMGAGLVNPTKALDPGLVYDLTAEDLIPYICGLGYNDSFVNDMIAQPMQNVSCAQSKKIQGKDLNYPSFLVTLTAAAPVAEARRTATNVGEPSEVYRAEVVEPRGVAVEVVPDRLEFGGALQRKEFTVRFKRGLKPAVNTATAGSLRWVSRKHSVHSPLAVLLVA